MAGEEASWDATVPLGLQVGEQLEWAGSRWDPGCLQVREAATGLEGSAGGCGKELCWQEAKGRAWGEGKVGSRPTARCQAQIIHRCDGNRARGRFQTAPL